MEYRDGPGRKAEDDRIVYVRTTGRIEIDGVLYEILTMHDWAYGGLLLAENEDRLYPRPQFRGGDKLTDYFRDCRRYGQRSADARHKLAQPSLPGLLT